MQRRHVRMAGAPVAQLDFLRQVRPFSVAQGVAVPAGEIEGFAGGESIEVDKLAHEIVGDLAAGREFAQDIHLLPVKGIDLGRRKPMEIQPMGWIGFGDGQVRQIDLVPVQIRHGPELVAPGLVESVDRTVPVGQETPEPRQRSLRVAQDSVMTAILVVRLPTDDPVVPAVTLGQGAGDAPAFRAVHGAGEAVVAA